MPTRHSKPQKGETYASPEKHIMQMHLSLQPSRELPGLSGVSPQGWFKNKLRERREKQE
jgi:hypothetical protein